MRRGFEPAEEEGKEEEEGLGGGRRGVGNEGVRPVATASREDMY